VIRVGEWLRSTANTRKAPNPDHGMGAFLKKRKGPTRITDGAPPTKKESE